MVILMGIVLVALAGLGTGSIAWPMKLMQKLEFEHYWFVGMLVALVIVPWLIVLSCVPDPYVVYASVGAKPLIISNLLSTGWGLANVLYAICVLRIGAALTGAIMTAFGLSIAATMPMVFKGTGLFSAAPDILSKPGLTVLLGIVLILAAAVSVTLAGFGRERALRNVDQQTRQKQAAGGFLIGLALAIACGVGSAFLSLSFVYSQGPIVEAAKAQGTGDLAANFAVWSGGLVGGALVNLLYPVYLMTKRKSWGMLVRCWRDFGLGIVIGIQFIAAVIMMGRGMLLLGALGASIGIGIQQAMQIVGNQAVGFISGEWHGVLGRPRNQMYLALGLLVLGVIVLACVNIADSRSWDRISFFVRQSTEGSRL